MTEIRTMTTSCVSWLAGALGKDAPAPLNVFGSAARVKRAPGTVLGIRELAARN